MATDDTGTAHDAVEPLSLERIKRDGLAANARADFAALYGREPEQPRNFHSGDELPLALLFVGRLLAGELDRGRR